ncbi:MAG: hypothetical protein QNK23_02425 [Crocinitomicaceae bacterium]|nr:hypothetical protein [Crocinitomicaceae bacterium]
MKFILSIFIVLISLGASASDINTANIKKDAAVEVTVNFDRRDRINRRKNRRRKRKCGQWGRRSYAG